MAKFVFELNQSIDGYVDHLLLPHEPALFLHFTERMRGMAGLVYGRRMYEDMRYWDEDRPEWGEKEKAYADAWRRQPKWVVSRTLTSVGPNATLVKDEVEATMRALKERLDGEIGVAGPELAASLTALGLIDEYQPYIHPAVLGSGKPYFAAARPLLRLTASERIGESVIRLTYVPA